MHNEHVMVYSQHNARVLKHANTPTTGTAGPILPVEARTIHFKADLEFAIRVYLQNEKQGCEMPVSGQVLDTKERRAKVAAIDKLLSQPTKFKNRPLTERYPAETITKIKSDLRAVAKVVRSGGVAPSYRQLAAFMLKQHKVETTPHTMKALLNVEIAGLA